MALRNLIPMLNVSDIEASLEFYRDALDFKVVSNAAAVILAHNHPSGVAEPSRADTQLTRRLTDALGLVDVRVLDHIVVGGAKIVSFAERGLL